MEANRLSNGLGGLTDGMKDVYKSLFKKQKVNLKRMESSENDEESTMYFELPGKVGYAVLWPKNQDTAHYGRTEGDEIIDGHSLNSPTAAGLAYAIAKEYKTFMKSKSFIRQMISKVMKGGA